MKACAIQCTRSDLIDNIDHYNAIFPLKKAGIFDHISLVCPEGIDESMLRNKAEKWGVSYFSGEAQNIAKRFLDFATVTGADTVVRVLPQWFFISPILVENAMTALERKERSEIVQFPYDFDIRFGGDICKAHFFEHALSFHQQLEPNSVLFNPWSLAETHPEEFNVTHVTETPAYDLERFNNDRKIMRKMWPEHWQQSHMPCAPYRKALAEFKNITNFNTSKWALDLACGDGTGSQFLADQGFNVIGVDIDHNAIDECKRRRSSDKLNFICSDYRFANIEPKSLDLVVSIHTMEHVESDIDFIKKIHSWLQPGGLLAIEVPILLAKPYIDINKPISPYHVKEYRYDDLRTSLAEKFTILKSFGVNRGRYLDINKMRNAALIICQKHTDGP